MNRDLLTLDPGLAASVREVFGSRDDPMEVVEARASLVLPGRDAIVWEGDAATFHFTYVGEAAERVLGYPVARWREPGFWAEVVVHPDDRGDAVGFCALATGQCRDHDFEYRGCTAAGDVVRLHDVVIVLRGSRGVAERLRGIMIPQREAESPA